VQCQKLQQVFELQSFGLGASPRLFCNSFIVLSIILCSKSAHKSAVQVCDVASVVTETTQLVLTDLKTFTVIR